MKQRFEKGRNRKRNMVKNEEEIKGLLTKEQNQSEEKETSEVVEIDEQSPLKRYDLGSKWKNIETVFGSSIIHWLIPLDWTEDELYKRMMNRSFSFDLIPCKTNMS